MTRFLNCNLQQKFIPSDFDGYEIITPNRHAARSLKVSENSLESIALKTISRANLKVASPIISHQILREAAGFVYGDSESEKAARSLRSSIQTLIRTNLYLADLSVVQAEKLQDLSKVTKIYLEKLHGMGLIDAAEILWKAIEHRPRKRVVYIYGYFRPRADELAFIDSISADKSIFCLPNNDNSIFKENQDAIKLLQQNGWIVSNSLFDTMPEDREATVGENLALAFVSAIPAPTQDGFQVLTYPNIESEVRGVLSLIKNKLISGVAPDRLGLIVRDDSIYGPIVSAISWEYQIPVRVLYDVPLINTRLGN